MKRVLKSSLLLGLLLSVTACAGQGETRTAQNLQSVESINSTEDESRVEKLEDADTSKELTIDKLLALCGDDGLAKKIETEGLESFLQYENLEQVDMGASLTGLYACNLEYVASADDETQEKTYELQLYYWKPETAKEYGQEENKIDSLLLVETTTGDAVSLYRSDSYCMLKEDFQVFLEKEYDIEQYMTLDVPKGYEIGNYVADIADFSGCWLLEGDAEEPIHSEWTAVSWYAPGGIAKMGNASQVLQFEEGQLTGAFLTMNHSQMISAFEMVEGCETMAVLGEYEFDLFTAAEWEEYLVQNPTADESENVSHYWYVFMGEEGKDTCYVLFLNEDLFSKEDAVKMAQSVHFTE